MQMTLATKEKLAGIVFGVFALFFLVLGVKNIGSSLAGPERDTSNVRKGIEYEVQDDFKVHMDTDGDGLSDLEEQTVYKTSAFIVDTDSDGISDGQEIAEGTNPLCPAGGTCFRGDLGVSLDEKKPAIQMGATVVPSGGSAGLQNGSNQQLAGQQASAEVPIEEIRQLMVEAGADPQQLAAISDEELRKLYNETVGTPEFQEQQKVFNAFSKKDPAQIRDILRSQGIPEETLAQVTDEQLIEIFQEALAQGQ